MDEPSFPGVSGLESFRDADAAVARIAAIYDSSAEGIRRAFRGGTAADGGGRYPFVGIGIRAANLAVDARLSYGVLLDPGTYGTTLTRPDVFRDYYREQIGLLIRNHRMPVWVGVSDRVIPLPFVIEESTADVSEEQVRALQSRFRLPDLRAIDDAIANGTHRPTDGQPKPLALFSAERVDFSLHRLAHYTATSPRHFQRFVLLTNYQRYVEEFRKLARAAMAEGGDGYALYVEPGDVEFRPGYRLP